MKSTIEKIRSGEVEVNRITKTVLVIDEAQDMNADEFALISTLMELNEDMRVIAVGDDDQNIYEFRGASSKYLEQFITERKATKHELIENYRSKNNLVEFTNGFAKKIGHRLKETTISAKQTDNGNIKLVCYQNGNLISPLVHDILTTDLSGTTCVLTKTNDEALQITGLLLKNGMQAKLIQSNDGFGLQNLLEIRSLLNAINLEDEMKVISDEIWANAKRELKTQFRLSSKLELCENLIKQFEESNSKKKYKSDLEVFIRESKLEDFYNENGETIFVSTIHKSKGKEFDNVFLMLENFNASTDESKRQLYVGMTRAKRNLTIHSNGNYLDNITAENLERMEDRGTHLPPNELAMHLSLKDVWLDYFTTRQHLVSGLTSGENLLINGDECTTSKGQSVLRFSRQALNTIEAQRQRGYHLKQAKVNFIVYWLKEGADQEIKIVLPELYFEKR
ncbi:MAG: UvrD/REP helicase [Bacteroidetes bacterium OLB12]|nr:MAG: UvrD/REP helicase [Bacteroidetes bacterium OLB12]